MANPERGEVSLTIGETTYTMVMNFRAKVAAQVKAREVGLNLTWDQIVSAIGLGDAECFQIFIWASLRKHHPSMKLDDILDFIDAAGGEQGLERALKATYESMTPDPRDVKALGVETRRPRKARAVNGTGENLSSRPVVSA